MADNDRNECEWSVAVRGLDPDGERLRHTARVFASTAPLARDVAIDMLESEGWSKLRAFETVRIPPTDSPTEDTPEERAYMTIDDACSQLCNAGEWDIAWFIRGAIDAYGNRDPDLPGHDHEAYLAGHRAAKKL